MGKRGKYEKKTPVICPLCNKEFIGSSLANTKGCPKYECSTEWARRKREQDTEYYRDYRKLKRSKNEEIVKKNNKMAGSKKGTKLGN